MDRIVWSRYHLCGDCLEASLLERAIVRTCRRHEILVLLRYSTLLRPSSRQSLRVSRALRVRQQKSAVATSMSSLQVMHHSFDALIHVEGSGHELASNVVISAQRSTRYHIPEAAWTPGKKRGAFKPSIIYLSRDV